MIDSIFESYREFQEIHPLVGSMLTASMIYPIGDIVSQLITDKKIDWKKVRYTASLSPLYGLAIHGLMETGDLAGELISDNPLTKAALGPNLWGNLYNTFFFVNNTVGEKKNYSLEELVKNYGGIFKRISPTDLWDGVKEKYLENIPVKEYFNSVIATLTAWNVFQYCNYAYVSDEMQTPMTLAAGTIWISLLSLWSLRGRRKIVDSNR